MTAAAAISLRAMESSPDWLRILQAGRYALRIEAKAEFGNSTDRLMEKQRPR